jgi:hypothetical protein
VQASLRQRPYRPGGVPTWELLGVHHEAGHAVVAELLGAPVAGIAAPHVPPGQLPRADEWQVTPRPHFGGRVDAWIYCRLAILSAGRVAEDLVGNHPGLDLCGGDDRKADTLVRLRLPNATDEEVWDWRIRAEMLARSILQRPEHALAVRTIAAALLRTEWLSGELVRLLLYVSRQRVPG